MKLIKHTIQKSKQTAKQALAGIHSAVVQREPVRLASGIALQAFGFPNEHVFFGYHDVTPFNADGDLLLALRCSVNAAPSNRHPALLGYFRTRNGAAEFRKIQKTTAWCWQQGSRLQWLPAWNPNTVIYNDTRSGRHVSVVYNVDSEREEHHYDRPIYSVRNDGRYAISLNMARLQRLRPGYGYADLQDETVDQPAPDSEGVWLLDLRDGKSELLFSVHDAERMFPHPSMENAQHYFNHVLWSQAGRKFFILHIWISKEGVRRSQALIYELASRSLSMAAGPGHISHHCWLDDDSMIIYFGETSTGSRYQRVDVFSNRASDLGTNAPEQDGHPSLSPRNSELMVTDTYPNRFRLQSLLLYNIKRNELSRIGQFRSPIAFSGEGRCDLHPRWDPTGTKICVDSAHERRRQLCVVDVASLTLLDETGVK